jgi:hypothetical protein
MLNWQLRKLTGQLMLAQEHASDTSCPCEYSDEHEYCLVKHLIHIQSLAEETIAMTEDARLKDILSGIAGAANDLRRAYEESPEDKRPYADIAQFARDARKAIEPYLFRYKQPAALKQKEPRWCLLNNNNKEGEEKMKTELKAHPKTAEEIYIEAQKALEAADEAYHKVYSIRKSNFECTSGLGTVGIYGRYCKPTPEQEKLIKKYSAESSRHRARWKRLMDKLEWDPIAKEYKLKAEMAQDPLLTEIASQLCTGGTCLAGKVRYKPGEIVKYKDERVRVLEHIGDRVDIFIPSRQKEVWVKPEMLQRIERQPIQENPLPICSPSEAKALERCIIKVKAKQPKYCEKEWHKPPEEMREGCYNPFAICRASVGCRLGGMPKYEERIKS